MSESGRLVVLAPPRLARVVRSRLGTGGSRELEVRPLPRSRGPLPDPFGLDEIAKTDGPEIAGVVVISPSALRPAEAAPSAVIRGVPVGVVPADTVGDLVPWLEAVTNRQDEPSQTAAVLSMWKPFYLTWARRFAAALRASRWTGRAGVHSWFATDVHREDLCARLAEGPNLVFYVGHGRTLGWSGYRGLRWRHLAAVPLVRPAGTVISLTCSNLGTPRNGGVPFGLRWVRSGRACAFLGAVGSLDIKALARISTEMLAVLRLGPRSLGGFVAAVDRRVRALPGTSSQAAWGRFRIVGSPTQAL